MTAQPLWQNEEWEIYTGLLSATFCDDLMGFESIFKKREITDDAPGMFKFIAETYRCDPDLLYDAFLQLATLWDLQCNYDDLRKIRDQAKQEKTG